MNLLKLTDKRLADLRQAVANETRRRTQMAANGHDPAAIIWGNEMAKRAVQVAAAGNHSILFIGPSNSGKTMLRAVGLALGIDDTYEARVCPCGNHDDPRAVCHCTAAQIRRTVARFPTADITVQVVRPLERETGVTGTTLADMQRYISDMALHTDESLDAGAAALLKAAIRELSFDPVAVTRTLQVARTIANLDHQEQISGSHMAEAINYRPIPANVLARRSG